MTQDEQQMRAVTQDAAGGVEVLCVHDVARPKPGPTEVLVRVRAAGVNPADWKTRAGGSFMSGETPPFTLGWDVAGEVVEVGRGVTLHSPGDAVFGMPRFPHPAGAYAEYVVSPARHLAPRPAGMSWEEAGGLPLAGLTAWQALVDTAGVEQGQRVLVHAGSGGVGHLAVQIAKARGAYVIATASAANHETVLRLGADEMIDYRTQDFADVVRNVDIVLETIGGDNATRSLRTLRPGGTLVSIRPADETFLIAAAEQAGVAARVMVVEPDLGGLQQLAALVEQGRLRVLVDSVYDLDHVAEAHRRGETGRTVGKIVLTP